MIGSRQCQGRTIAGAAAHIFPLLESGAYCTCGDRVIGDPTVTADSYPVTPAGVFVDPPGVMLIVDEVFR